MNTLMNALIKKFSLSLEEQNLLIEEIKKNKSLIDSVLDLELIDEVDLYRYISKYLKMPYKQVSVNLSSEVLINKINISYLKTNLIFPFSYEDNKVDVLIYDPYKAIEASSLHYYLDNEINIYLTSRSNLLSLIEFAEHKKRRKEAIVELKKEITEESKKQSDNSIEAIDSPSIQLADSILKEAIASQASDIHIEPFEDVVRVRFRIDGFLQEYSSIPQDLYQAVLARFKILASMDISERRIPQDGKISLEINKEKYDYRVSTLPVLYGEKVVIRIYNTSNKKFGLTKLGFDEKQLKVVTSMITNPHGIILLTGPTGSGKTTTLYSFLRELNNDNINITTIEDPVENQIYGINQTQVNPKANLTFASSLRSILRQDPNVIMIGEIRDEETAEIAVKAAITGHLVFSTIHTNDAPGTVTRLIDMGIQNYLVGDALIGAISQRLVRNLCPHCKKRHKTTKEEMLRLGLNEPATIYQKCGCEACNHTGYLGRTGVFEIMQMKPSIREAINDKDNFSSIKLRERCIKEGMEPILESCKRLVLDGKTSFEEYYSLIDSTLSEESK